MKCRCLGESRPPLYESGRPCEAAVELKIFERGYKVINA